jgi:glycerate 2-kinase
VPELLAHAAETLRLRERLTSRPYHLIAVGKASPFMAGALVAQAGVAPVRGIAIGTHCPLRLAPRVDWIQGHHPVPDARSEDAGRRALTLASTADPGHLLVVLISGGASALMVQPREGVTLDDKQATTRQLLLGGANIDALNTVRKHLSAIKGGQLASAARGPVLALAVSDVVGDDPSVIGSGPTVADPSTFADALAVLERHGGASRFPASVVGFLERGAGGDAAETPKPGDPRLARAETHVIGSRHDAVRGAAEQATRLGYDVAVLSDPVVGEARDAGRRLARLLRGYDRPVCLVAAGETTVTVTGKGRGGRNQELVLAAAQELDAWGHPAAVLSGGTDGIDGPTDAAGAVADQDTIAQARAAGLGDGSRHLEENDAHAFFQELGGLLKTGPTDTNVGDIQILVRS